VIASISPAIRTGSKDLNSLLMTFFFGPELFCYATRYCA
jgi:hypothetical protein